MSENFFADTIASNLNQQHSIVASGQEENIRFNDCNSMSNEIRLMENHHSYQKGRTGLGTPDANITYASTMSSDSINNNKNIQEQHLSGGSSTSQESTRDYGFNVQDLFSQLHEALALEPKYQPNLFLPQQSNVNMIKHLY